MKDDTNNEFTIYVLKAIGLVFLTLVIVYLLANVIDYYAGVLFIPPLIVLCAVLVMHKLKKTEDQQKALEEKLERIVEQLEEGSRQKAAEGKPDRIPEESGTERHDN